MDIGERVEVAEDTAEVKGDGQVAAVEPATESTEDNNSDSIAVAETVSSEVIEQDSNSSSDAVEEVAVSVGDIASGADEGEAESASAEPAPIVLSFPKDETVSKAIIDTGAEKEQQGSPEKTEQHSAEVEEEGEEDEEEKPLLPELDEERAALPWYAVHTYSGFEARVKLSLEERIRNAGVTQKFGNILVPQETVEELVRGKRKKSSRKLFPGYIMVQMNLDDETWHILNDTPKVTGFVGDSRNPMPLSESEVVEMIGQLEGGGSRPRPRVQFEEGDAVKVVDGPFSDFNGTVDEVRPDKGKLRVLISIFGRNTPVELDFVQVEKL